MGPDTVLNLAENAVLTILLVAGPLLIAAVALGLMVAIFQATTQIQEQTLAFIPKIVGVLAALIAFGPWMLSQVTNFGYQVLSNLHNFIG
ncbi:flagellar biosynthetic protein FliQ [Salsuginibacillus halophilus]|uniref:Flagellar biosynthetic protein FliQ n=1 Tax=Salsuginibacillus halophilus TaxID=517424 RepID=A0A2P8HYG7_9BACI|nr:flagellar biosynthesis protein FliQ [Salsuginibacillus halophilus]PSL51204.1 flagellar biosynthetic protein FliQ [Salsuginibacillus halophilus]